MSEKTNEIPVAKAVMPTLPLADWVCTADALHTHADFMHPLHEQQADAVLTVKGNQPTLFADRATYFADPQAFVWQAETWDRWRGRVEHHVIRVSSELNAYLAADWPHVAQVAQLIRTVTKAGTTSTEVVYLIPSLSPQRASPQRLLALMCGHWGIGATRFAETSESAGMASKVLSGEFFTCGDDQAQAQCVIVAPLFLMHRKNIR